MNESERQRLAKIRASNETWQATEPSAYDWEASFLLRVIDELSYSFKIEAIKQERN